MKKTLLWYNACEHDVSSSSKQTTLKYVIGCLKDHPLFKLRPELLKKINDKTKSVSFRYGYYGPPMLTEFCWSNKPEVEGGIEPNENYEIIFKINGRTVFYLQRDIENSDMDEEEAYNKYIDY